MFSLEIISKTQTEMCSATIMTTKHPRFFPKSNFNKSPCNIHIDVWVWTPIKTSPVASSDKANMMYSFLYQAPRQYSAEHKRISQFKCYISLLSTPNCEPEMESTCSSASMCNFTHKRCLKRDFFFCSVELCLCWQDLCSTVTATNSLKPAIRRPFGKISFPKTHKITSSSTGRDKGSEDFILVTF